MTIGDRIKQRRSELKMSQEDLAKKMGYETRNAIYQFEKKDNMKLSLVEKFAEALECTPAYLMGWEEKNGEKTIQGQLIDIYADRIKQEKANALYDQYMSLPPEKQAQFDNFLKFLQSDSELPHLH